MNIKKLKEAEAAFLKKYPNGFAHSEMLAIAKKHKMEQMIALAQKSFKKSHFTNLPELVADMVKIISRSSMVSMFEKPKFRDFVKTLDEDNLKKLAQGLKKFLYSDQEKGFNAMIEVLSTGKLAKWSLLTIIPNYVHPNDEVFIKPTTAKGVIDYFELKNLQYKPAPTWKFYRDYKAAIMDMKAKIDSSITINNAAFSGFLMMSLC